MFLWSFWNGDRNVCVVCSVCVSILVDNRVDCRPVKTSFHINKHHITEHHKKSLNWTRHNVLSLYVTPLNIIDHPMA